MLKSNKKMLKLRGGLGNQMFQYAFTCALSKKFDAEIIFDFSFFEEIKSYKDAADREYELGNFNLECRQATQEELEQIVYPKRMPKYQKILWEICKLKKYKPEGNCFLEKSPYNYTKNPLTNPDYYYYHGYFQNEKYFKHVRNDILEKFSLKETLDEKNKNVLDKISEENSISIHIRRGDYVELEAVKKVHGVCSLKYYQNAIKYISKHVKNPHFFLFSDDVKWVVENLKIDYPYTIADFNQGKGWLDLNLMKHCKHNIIANSSFSWWAAWLNENPDKIVIAPKKWIAEKQKCDIVPEDWVKI